MSQTYEYYVNLWLEGVSMQSGVDYGNPNSIKRYNKGSDLFRKAATAIGKHYPERVPEFAELMINEDEKIRLLAAISVAEYMPHTREQLEAIIEIVKRHMDNPDCIDPRSGWEWWLKQPWAQEKNCIDLPD